MRSVVLDSDVKPFGKHIEMKAIPAHPDNNESDNVTFNATDKMIIVIIQREQSS